MGGDDALRFGGVLHAGVVAEGWVVTVLVAVLVSVVLTLLVVAILMACTSVVSPRVSSGREGARWWQRANDAAAGPDRSIRRTVGARWRGASITHRANAVLYVLALVSLTALLVELVGEGGEESTRVRAANEAPSPRTAAPGGPTTTGAAAPSTSTTAAPRTATTRRRGPDGSIPAPFVPSPDDALALRARRGTNAAPPPAVTRPPAPPTTALRTVPTTISPARTTTSRPRTSTTARPLVLPGL